MVETDDDRTAFLADFGQAATYTPSGGTASTITVIFDNDYIDVDLASTVAFATQQPKVVTKTISVPNAAEGDVLQIDGVNYVIRVVMNDGTGMTEMMLEKP